jgi:hypothetical protein
MRIEKDDYITSGFLGTGQSGSDKPLALLQPDESHFIGKVGLDVTFQFTLQLRSVAKIVNEDNLL